MEPDQQLARDRHMEVLSSIKDLRTELTATRLEVKNDLLASRVEYLANLAEHTKSDEAEFAAIRKEIGNLKGWKTKTATLGSLLLILITTATAFGSAALASGKLG